MKITAMTRMRHQVRRMIQQGAPDYGDRALPLQAAEALTERDDPASLLPYIDYEDNYCVRDDGKHPQLGFGVQFAPLMVAGKDIEEQIESLITRAPADTVIQFVAHSSPAIEDRINTWQARRLRYCKDPMLQELVERRSKHMLDAAAGNKSLLPNERLYPREVHYFAFFTMTFGGDPEHAEEIRSWRHMCDEFRQSVMGTFSSMGLSPALMNELGTRRVLRRIANPQMVPGELQRLEEEGGHFIDSIFDKRTRIRVKSSGAVQFSDNEREVDVVPLTIDTYPDYLRLYMTGDMLGELKSATDRIAPAYWMYTTIYKPNTEKARDDITMRMGMISKQCMSDSEWYKGMMPHLFTRRRDTQQLLNDTRSNYCPVRMWSGINIITEPERAASDADYVSSLWRKAGFRASRERYISLPIWLSSLPWGYNPRMDKPTSGLQRAQMVSSLNGACASICQGDWGGNGPVVRKDPQGNPYLYANGLLLVSRRGQMSCIDIFDSATSYNFSVIATSGAGKSFLANEFVTDMRCRDGVVRIIDVGGSYKELCELLGGQELRFDPNHPVSLNPFWGIKGKQRYDDDEGGSEIAEMIPVLKDAISQMAFPLGEPDNYEYQLIEKGILEAHDKHGEVMETKHVYQWLESRADSDPVAKSIALQLEPYAVGRHAAWFNGEPQLDLSNEFTILELEELNVDRELRNVVMTLLMARTTRDMYLRPRNIPKMMLIDEAWDLLADPKSGKFIETAFRRIRKYYGSAGFITQGFKDTDLSPAAQAAFDNAPWTFVLKQSGPSLDYAQKNGKLGGEDEFLFDMLRGVKPGAGYSEVFVKHESGGGLFRFVVDPYSYFLYSTNPKDQARLMKLTSAGYNTQEAIRMLAEGQG
ncbi:MULTISPECIES: TraC family protein [Halomonadaceae]|jgi:conjugal transfer ATP-binding protein TraC|uniref:TraC family protein n=1 Tax=Vreelandella glaciei TaxID=186761 RepID=A0A7Z0RZK1_9GAMM|nr:MULTISPECIES: TraC family protein [Halomonas]AJY53058.1 Type-IV secretion system protein TraC/Conjugative transfer ATPase [Halomonas sp. KO116]MBL1270222.1 TraC family protein [Halomonas sp.]MBL1270659.1 TraC family protein [Halomonas sp.]NYS79427.1 TraC family protein [Halomonas glaciei]|tara:strand:- start:1987 stop:4599 length:2613 start_codon:yes stop_codon:yes gene_type:complete